MESLSSLNQAAGELHVDECSKVGKKTKEKGKERKGAFVQCSHVVVQRKTVKKAFYVCYVCIIYDIRS